MIQCVSFHYNIKVWTNPVCHHIISSLHHYDIVQIIITISLGYHYDYSNNNIIRQYHTVIVTKMSLE